MSEQQHSVLFIGNSYTYYNDMPSAIFAPIADAAGISVKVRAITKGGHYLYKYADPSDEYGAIVDEALSSAHNGEYDFVILQEQSQQPAGEDAAVFFDSVRSLSARIRTLGAQPILYSTWGRESGCPVLAQNGWTNESMTWKLAASYSAIGEECSIPTAMAGLAFFDVYTSHPEIGLYNPDQSHPSYAGSYLAAMTLLGRIFQVRPTSIRFDGELDSDHAAILRAAAEKAVFDPPAVPEAYRMSSVGVTMLDR